MSQPRVSAAAVAAAAPLSTDLNAHKMSQPRVLFPDAPSPFTFATAVATVGGQQQPRGQQQRQTNALKRPANTAAVNRSKVARCSVENSGEIEALVPAAQDADAGKAEAAKATAAARAAAAEPVASDGNVTSSKCDHCTLEDTNRDQLEVHDAACIGQCIYIYPSVFL